MSASKKIFNNTLALAIATASQLVGNVILFFYLSRLLQSEGLGIYSTVLAVFQTVSLGCGIGFNSYLPRELARDLSKTNHYFIHASLVSVITSLLIIAGIVLLVPQLNYLPETKTGLYIISAALVAESIQVVLHAIFIAHQKAQFITLTGLLNIFGRISISLLVLHLGFGVVGLVVTYTTFSFLSVLLNLFFFTRHILVPHLEFDKQFLLKMLGEIKVFAALALLNATFSQSEILVLSLTRGETQVGYYSAALKLVMIWSLLPGSYMTAMFPVLSAIFQESIPRAINLQNRSLKYLLAIAFPLTVGMAITAGAIIPLFYGPAFQESVGTLRILAWYLPLIFINNLLWRILFVRGEQHIVFRGQLISEIVQVVLAVGLTPKFGCTGAAWALLGGNLTYAAYHVYYVQRDKTPFPLFQLGWRFSLASVVMGLFTWLITPRFSLFVVIPAAAVIYLFVLLVLRTFSSDDMALLRQVLGFSRKVQLAQ